MPLSSSSSQASTWFARLSWTVKTWCAKFPYSLLCCADEPAAQIRFNDTCRRLGKPFYAGGTYGLLGYIFCDLLQHDYIAPYVCDP